MITSCARIMAVATIATARCSSFLHSGSRFSRTSARVAKKCAGLRLSSMQIEPGTKARGSADDASLDSSLISTNPELVIEHLKARRMGEDSIQAVYRIGELMDSRREFITTKNNALKQRNAMSAQIGKLMKAGQADEAEEKKCEVEGINKIASSAEKELNKVDEELNTLLMRLPNLLDSRVPDGDGEEENVIVSEWGQEYVKSGEEFIWHDEVATKLGGWDPEGAARISGARFSVLKGPLARLERALGQWLLDVHTNDHGYTEVSVPLLVTRSSLEGTGQLPKFENDLFKTNHRAANENSFLIPTGEVPLTNLLRGQLLDKAQNISKTVGQFFSQNTFEEEDSLAVACHQYCQVAHIQESLTFSHRVLASQVLDGAHACPPISLEGSQALPVSLVALTPCFRAEAGSAGRDTRGLLRQHQFLKVELVKITSREDSQSEHETLTQHAEAVLKALKLPFRRVSLCSGDIGFGARLCYDLEVWMPGQGAYREISSCSNCQDFQARRMALRYREPMPEAKKKRTRNVLCHTINGSGVAVGRALVAVLENYYNPADGSVEIPDVLRPYMGGADKLNAL